MHSSQGLIKFKGYLQSTIVASMTVVLETFNIRQLSQAESYCYFVCERKEFHLWFCKTGSAGWRVAL